MNLSSGEMHRKHDEWHILDICDNDFSKLIAEIPPLYAFKTNRQEHVINIQAERELF